MATRESKQQYLDLRRRLSDLNYTENFNADASELVSHLLSDLVATTNSYKIVQEKEARIASDLALSQAQLFPLRKENARLARENHDLHNDTIRLNDEIRNSTEDSARELQRMQEHLQDSRFLCESLQEQLRQKSDTMDKLRSAYDAVTDPSLKSQGSASALNSARAIKITSRVGKQAAADIEALRAAPASSASSSWAAEKEGIIKTLRSQLEAANKAFSAKDEECRRLVSAVAAREQEISRSSKLISAGAKGAAGAADVGAGGAGSGLLLAGSRVDQYVASDIANKRLIDQLNGQVDFLNNELAKREAQLVEVNDKLLQYEQLRAEFTHRNQLLEQARRDAGQATMRIRALEQKVIEYQHAETEFAMAAAEMGGSGSLAPGSPSTETKQLENNREAVELKVLLGRVSAERDELREETARLRRITSTITTPLLGASSSTGGDGGGLRGKVGAAGLPGKRGGAKVAATPADAAGTAGNRVNGQKEKQQAATNVLVMELNDQVESLRKKEQVLTRSLAQKDEHLGAMAAERDSWQVRVEASDERKDKAGLQRLHSELQEQYSLSQLQLAERNRERQQLQSMFDAAKDELGVLRNDLHEARSVREEVEMRLTVVSKDLVLCKQTCARQSDDLSHTSVEASRLRMECEDLKEAVRREQLRAESAQGMVVEAQDLLDMRSVELSEALHKLALLQMGVSAEAQHEGLQSENRKRLQLRVQELEAEHASSQRERRALQRLAQCLGVQFRYERSARGQLEEQEVALMIETISRKDAEISSAKDSLERALEANSRLESDVHQEMHHLNSVRAELDTVHAQLQDQVSLSAQLQSDLTLAQQRYADLKARQEEAQQLQADTQSQSAGALHQLSVTRRELQTHQEAEMRMQQAVSALEEERDLQRRQLEELNRRSRADRADLQRVISERQVAEDRQEELKVLIANLEASAQASSQKQHRLAADLNRGEEEHQSWDAERARLLAAVDEKERRVREQQDALQRVDRERDRLQEQVDAMEDDIAQHDALLRTHEHQHSTLKLVLEQTERKVQTISTELTSSQRHAQAADARLNASQLEISELKRRLSQKTVEVGGASEDLMLMTRENQALTSELVEVSGERDRLQQRLQQVLHASASTEHARRSVEVERSDLLNTYRTVLQEKRKLEEDLTQLSSRKQAEGLAAHQLQDKVSELQGVVAAQAAAETRWRGERAALVSQLDTLNDQLVRAQHKMENIEADNRKMAHDTSGLKQNNVMLNERINMIIKRASAATEANKLLTGRLGAVERERDAVRALVGIERQRAADMSHIAESARVESATKELHIQRLRAVTTTTTTVTSSNRATSHTEATSASEVNDEFLTGDL